MAEVVKLRIDDRIAEVMLNRPEAYNAFNLDMVELLGRHLIDLAGDDDVTAGSVRFGGLVQRISLDPDTGWLAVAEGKTRHVYQIAASDLVASNVDNVRGTRLPFAVTDQAARDGETASEPDPFCREPRRDLP